MIKAVLLDLDDTLIHTNTPVFFPAYMESLGQFGASALRKADFATSIMQEYLRCAGILDPTSFLIERLLAGLSVSFGISREELASVFQCFYEEVYPSLGSLVQPNPEAPQLLDYLFDHGYQVVLATNPGLPESATLQRMAWGSIPPASYPFSTITSLENMHFSKPHSEYYEEIMLRLNLSPGEAIMIGDDFDQDITGAARAGLCTYWVSPTPLVTRASDVTVNASGSFHELVRRITGGWLDTLTPPPSSPNTLLSRLRAFPAAIDMICRAYSPEILECAPAEREWAARDIICHLLEHEAAEDRSRLQRILDEENPFISANYDPWAHAHEYSRVDAHIAFGQFASLRLSTLEWLSALPSHVWARPARYAIFGPTTFEEMVKFTTEHDLTHLRQMHRAIENALNTCGTAPVGTSG